MVLGLGGFRLLVVVSAIAAVWMVSSTANAGSLRKRIGYDSRTAPPVAVRSLGHAQPALWRASMALTGLGRAQRSEHGRPHSVASRGSNPALQGTYTHDALGNLAAAAYADGKVDLRMPDAVGNLFRTEQRNDRRYGPAGQLLESWDAFVRDWREKLLCFLFDGVFAFRTEWTSAHGTSEPGTGTGRSPRGAGSVTRASRRPP